MHPSLPEEGEPRPRGVGELLLHEARLYWRRALISFLAGAAVLLLMRIPVVHNSILGAPDREMLNSAFRIRADTAVGLGDPAVLLDIDDRSIQTPPYALVPPGREPPASVPRAMAADLLTFVLGAPRGREPAAVILDVDLGAPAGDGATGVAKMRAALSAWARTPGAPALALAREAFSPEILGLAGRNLVLPPSDYDDIVAAAPNIYWSTVKVLADAEGTVQEYMPFQCVSQGGTVQPLYSASLLAYGAAQGGAPPKGSPAAQAIGAAPAECARAKGEAVGEGQVIDFHLSLTRGEEQPVWPELPAAWPGFRSCGRAGDATVFRQVSAADVLAAGPDASRDLLCRRFVIIGGTNGIASDFQQTPLSLMSGPMILLNAARGLQMSNGGLRQASLWVQGGVLLVVSVAITISFSASRAARRGYRRYRAGASHWAHRLALLPLNPVVLNWVVALAAHWIGIGLLLVSLKFGFWGFLSGPAFGSATAETIQDFTEEHEQ